MANYTKVFEKPYDGGYHDLPLEDTPITAATLNAKDTAIEHIEQYLYDNPISGGGGGGGDIDHTIIVDEWDDETEYNVGDYVYSNGKLWKCLLQNSGQTPSSSSIYWEQTQVMSEIGQGGGGTDDYEDLSNLPSINGVTLIGNKTNADLSIPEALADLTSDSTHRTVTDTDIDNWDSKQDRLTAGTNITIDENNVISASGGGSSVTVVNNLNSTSTTDALSANMGHHIDAIKKTFHETTLDDLEEATADANVGDMIITSDEDVYYGNSPIDDELSTTSTNPVQNKVISAAVGVWSEAVSAAVGDTSVTINDSHIKTNGTFDEYSNNASNTRVAVLSRQVTNGSVTLTFSALSEATTFKLHIWG